MSKIKQELKELSVNDLVAKVDSLRRELFSLRLHAATQPLKDYTLYKKLRRDIARALTYLHQKSALQ
jgi:large subunit ribosomal protein L29